MSDSVKTAASSIGEAFLAYDDERVCQIARQRLEDGESPFEILQDAQGAMVKIGEQFEIGEAFLAELMLAGDVFQKLMGIIGPALQGGEGGSASKGKIVLGTVKGDIHNIGKDLVAGTLQANGYQVLDLGVDVQPEEFVQALESSGARILGLSGLISTSFQTMKATVEAVEEAGLRDQVKVMIGGAPVTERVCDHVGADGFGLNPIQAVRLADSFVGGDSHD